MDESRRCTDAPDHIGVGDAIVTPDSVGAHLRMSCAAALPLGGHAAETVLNLIRGDEPAPISVGFVPAVRQLGQERWLHPIGAFGRQRTRRTAHAPQAAWSRNASAASSSKDPSRNDAHQARTTPQRGLDGHLRRAALTELRQPPTLALSEFMPGSSRPGPRYSARPACTRSLLRSSVREDTALLSSRQNPCRNDAVDQVQWSVLYGPAPG